MSNKSIREILAFNMRFYRAKLDISQEELANLCELHRTYISDIERCTRNVSIDNIARISTALNISPSDLLREDNYDN